MRFLVSVSSAAVLLYLSQTSKALEQEPFRNDTVSWKTSPSAFSKRTVCSGTCEECYGVGSILCGDYDACYNPSIGQSCCEEYNYACAVGEYCAPNGLGMDCCGEDLTTDECINLIDGGGGSTSSGSSGLSTGAKVGIGIGVILLLLIVAGLALLFFLRRRNRRHIVAPAAPAWQMSPLPHGNGGPGVAQTGYDAQGRYDGPPTSYNDTQGVHESTIGVYNVTQGGHNNTQGGYAGGKGNVDIKSQQMSGGGPPSAQVYKPGIAP